jgi:hypothetical protein
MACIVHVAQSFHVTSFHLTILFIMVHIIYGEHYSFFDTQKEIWNKN